MQSKYPHIFINIQTVMAIIYQDHSIVLYLSHIFFPITKPVEDTTIFILQVRNGTGEKWNGREVTEPISRGQGPGFVI